MCVRSYPAIAAHARRTSMDAPMHYVSTLVPIAVGASGVILAVFALAWLCVLSWDGMDRGVSCDDSNKVDV